MRRKSLPVVEKTKVEVDCCVRRPKDAVKVLAGQPEVSPHHAIADGMACIQDCDIVGDIRPVMRDVKNRHTCPSTLGDQLKKMADRDMDRVFREGIEQTLKVTNYEQDSGQTGRQREPLKQQ
jgi:hypothetical protein